MESGDSSSPKDMLFSHELSHLHQTLLCYECEVPKSYLVRSSPVREPTRTFCGPQSLWCYVGGWVLCGRLSMVAWGTPDRSWDSS